MAIYLDANILWSWRTFDELDRVAVSIVAAQTQQRVLVPTIAAEEAEANLTRSLESIEAEWDAAVARLTDGFTIQYVYVEPVPSVERQVAAWRTRLQEFASPLPVDDGLALEALKREAWGTPPARRLIGDRGNDKGCRGARDAAIWLAIVRDHTARD